MNNCYHTTSHILIWRYLVLFSHVKFPAVNFIQIYNPQTQVSLALAGSVHRGGFRGGCTQHAPPLFFAEIGHLTLCGCPSRQKECTKLCELTLKLTIFSYFYPLPRGAHPPQTPLVHTGTEVLSILNLGAPLLKNPGSAPGSLWSRPGSWELRITTTFTRLAQGVVGTIWLDLGDLNQGWSQFTV